MTPRLRNPFEESQKKRVDDRLSDVEAILYFLGETPVQFQSLRALGLHVQRMLARDGKGCNLTTLTRKHHTQEGLPVPNPYWVELNKYMNGEKYFGKDNIAPEDIKRYRKKYPVIDDYCKMIELRTANLENEAKRLRAWVLSLQDTAALSTPDGGSTDVLNQLDQTCNALQKILDSVEEFEIDWKQRTIVDTSQVVPKIIVHSEFLKAFFSALEASGIKPPEDV